MCLVPVDWASLGLTQQQSSLLSSCLALAAPLAASAVSTQSRQHAEGLDAVPMSAEKVSYPALLALVAACQLNTAAALANSAEVQAGCMGAFALFWSPVCPW